MAYDFKTGPESFKIGIELSLFLKKIAKKLALALVSR